MEPFDGKVALITGGASGIGRALSRELSRAGATVVVADRNGPAAQAEAAYLSERGARAEAIAVDVSDGGAVERAVDDVWSRLGRIDYLFNNAGIGGPAAEFQEISLEDWRRVLGVNLMGVVHGAHAVYPRMIRRGSGHIVNTASIAGLVPSPLQGPYTTAKHGVVGLSKALRAEGKDLGIRVSVVCPGYIDTPIFTTSSEFKRLDWEALRKFLPSPLDVDACARKILTGVRKNRAVIPVGSRPLWWIERLFPGLTLQLATMAIRQVRKRFMRPSPGAPPAP